MKITYLGHSCFLIEGSVSVVTDPFSGIGYPLKRVKADYVLSSHDHFDHNAVSGVDFTYKMTLADAESPKVPKPFERINLNVIPSYHDDCFGKKRGVNMIYKFTIDGITFTHLGDFGEDFSVKSAEKIGKTDVLFVPVGGNYTIDALTAEKYVDFIDAKVVVPMHYKTKRGTVDIADEKEFVAFFKKVVYCKDLEADKYDMPSEKTIYVFDSRGF